MSRHLSQPHGTTYISSDPVVFYRKMFSKNFQKSLEKSCAKVCFSCNFCKKGALLQVSCEFCKFFKNTFFTEHHRRLLLDLHSGEPTFTTQALMVWLQNFRGGSEDYFSSVDLKLEPWKFMFYKETNLMK